MHINIYIMYVNVTQVTNCIQINKTTLEINVYILLLLNALLNGKYSTFIEKTRIF